MEAYVKSGRLLRQKFEELRFGQMMRDLHNLETYKPLVKPLQELASNIQSSSKSGEFDEQMVSKYLSMYKDPKIAKTLDKTYGLEYDEKNDNWFVGKKQVYFERGTFNLKGNPVKVKCTAGLLELLTSREPKRDLINPEDIENYYSILNLTSAHRKSNGHVKGSGGKKYSEWIKPMVNYFERGIPHEGKKLGLINVNVESSSEESSYDEDSIDQSIVGSGLSKVVSNAPVEYVYYDTLDELLDRLYILWGEVKAGNTSSAAYNELINILLEFKEL